MSNITVEDMDNLRHALGIDERTKPKSYGWRNYYHTDIDDPSMAGLVAAGFMRRGRTTTTPSRIYANFHVTPAGCRMVGLSEQKAQEVGR